MKNISTISVTDSHFFNKRRRKKGVRFALLHLTWTICFALNVQVVSAQNLQVLYKNLDNASSLYVTQNSIYVVEQGNNQLLKLNHKGRLIEALGGNGTGDYTFSRPLDVDATNGLKIYVTDYNNRRIQVFDRRGQYLSSISASMHFNRRRRFTPTQITVDKMRDVIVYDETSNSILRIDEDADLRDEFRLHREIDQVDDLKAVGQLLYILDKSAGQIHVLSENGSYELFYPAKNVLAFDTDGNKVWKAFARRIVVDDGREVRTIEFENDIQVVDIHVEDNIVFILSENALYKLQD